MPIYNCFDGLLDSRLKNIIASVIQISARTIAVVFEFVTMLKVTSFKPMRLENEKNDVPREAEGSARGSIQNGIETPADMCAHV